MSFDATLALNTILPLAMSAYNPALLPADWRIAAAIQPDDFGFIVQQEPATALDRAAIIIPGTRDVAQWFEDFDALVVPARYGGAGHVHKGFQDQYEAIRESILAGLQGLAFAELWIIGHSLGAALAVLTAMELAHREPSVWTFEGPRCGWFDWAHNFDQVIESCWRIENVRDIVCHCPNELVGYRHVGTAIPIDGGHTDSLKIAHGFEPSIIRGLQKLIAA